MKKEGAKIDKSKKCTVIYYNSQKYYLIIENLSIFERCFKWNEFIYCFW